MAEEPITSASVQHDAPARGHVESREETVERLAGHEEAVIALRGGSSDPSSRRGLNRWLGRNQAILAACGFVAGAVLGLVLSVAPGPAGTDSVPGTIGVMIVLGAAGVLGFVAIGSLLLLAREDGRVERGVEEGIGQASRAPGSPIAPENDPEPR